MTNFDFLKKEPKFDSFVDIAISAEKFILFDVEVSIFNCRRAMEMAIKWMYSVDSLLERPYQDSLQTLMNTDDFRQMIDEDLWQRLDFIRKCGNQVAHSGKKLSWDKAVLCLENLFIFFDYISYCYSDKYEAGNFQIQIILDNKQKAREAGKEKQKIKEELKIREEELAKKEIDLEALLKENAKLKEKLSARGEESRPSYVPKPLDLSEFETRKHYIDVMLEDAGWTEGKNWLNEVKVSGMPTKSGEGKVDYVLYDDRHVPLAIIEAKKTCKDVAVGRQQAKLYADCIEKIHGRRPVIFLTNGFETRIMDGQYPERKCSGIYSKRDLEKWFNLLSMRTSLKHITVDKNIAGRYYQEAAIKAVCTAFDEKNRRKALLVMATGSGKTRTVIALCKALLEAGWVKNILFLADRNALVRQAKHSFVNLLPNLSCTNLVEEKENYNAHCVLSTYQTMMNCIDNIRDEEGKIFSCGHFDLIICDEAHRSVYNKYKDIFDYFDAPLVGLTATPKEDLKNTYEIFDLETGVPTYGYELAQAVKDGYLVDYTSIETVLKFVDEGISYEELSEEEKEEYEALFTDEDGNKTDKIEATALNTWIFNEDTIIKVLDTLMTYGIKVDYGQKLGKTIIFAKNHKHAEYILKIFYKRYPHLVGFAEVIDNYINFAQKIIDDFSDVKKMPQIAISVDMLDTGIDIPEILNLVFFKKVLSKAKFWQMIGRGTRLCPGLMDGEDKRGFYIFDFCGNFEFFRMSSGKEATETLALQSAIFHLQFQIARRLQELEYQTEPLIRFRKDLVDEMCRKVKELSRENFAIHQRLKVVEMYSDESAYQNLQYGDENMIKDELAPYILPEQGEDVHALRFDALMYGLELTTLYDKPHRRAKKDLIKKAKDIAEVTNITEITNQLPFIKTLVQTDYLDSAGIEEWEEIRIKLRHLVKFIKKEKKMVYETSITDDILSMDWKEAELQKDELPNYRAKAEFYIRQHQDHIAIAKLRTNRPLTAEDIRMLEDIMWKEVGSKKDYEEEYGQKPLGELVREIVGLDMNAAKEAFSEFLNNADYDERQIYFVNQIVEYIVQNGMMKDFKVLQEMPFTNFGSVVDIFQDISVWGNIKKVIDEINANVVA